jgi:hypothetical protein
MSSNATIWPIIIIIFRDRNKCHTKAIRGTKGKGVTILNNNEKSRKQLKRGTRQKQRDAYLELT